MPKEDLLDKLVAEMRERGVEANVDPRMDSERAGTAFLTFYGAAGEPDPDSEKPGAYRAPRLQLRNRIRQP